MFREFLVRTGYAATIRRADSRKGWRINLAFRLYNSTTASALTSPTTGNLASLTPGQADDEAGLVCNDGDTIVLQFKSDTTTTVWMVAEASFGHDLF